MGAVKQWLMEQAEEERHAEYRAWFRDKYGRSPKGEERWDEFELDEAFDHAMSKDD